MKEEHEGSETNYSGTAGEQKPKEMRVNNQLMV